MEATVYFRTLNLDQAISLAEAIQGNPLLESLDLLSSTLGPEKLGGGLPQVEVLAAGLRGSSVISLRLIDTGLGDAGVKAVASVIRESSVQCLGLSVNGIGARGARALAEGLRSSRVTTLDLSHNNVGDGGAITLALALRESPLQTLDLGVNTIGEEGARALAKSLKDSSLTSLDLHGNYIGAKGMRALLDALRNSQVIEMEVSGQSFGEEWSKIRAVVQANKTGNFVLQVNVQQFVREEVELKFRTIAGSEAAVLRWSREASVQDLPEAVLASMRSSGFQLPCTGINAESLRLVRPDGAILDVGSTAASLAEQLGIELELGGP